MASYDVPRFTALFSGLKHEENERAPTRKAEPTKPPAKKQRSFTSISTDSQPDPMAGFTAAQNFLYMTSGDSSSSSACNSCGCD